MMDRLTAVMIPIDHDMALKKKKWRKTPFPEIIDALEN